MGLTADGMRRLAALGLTGEQFSVVLSVLANAMEDGDERREKDRARAVARRTSLPNTWGELRQTVFERDNFTCVYCGATDNLACDHVLALMRGGRTELSNLATACKPCNSSKGARLLDEWRGRQ